MAFSYIFEVRTAAVKVALSALGIAALVGAAALRPASHASTADLRLSNDDRAGARTPVLVELFTSEGCSSCPPADALLEKLDQQQPVAGTEVIALEEHVTYWDQQGWVDPFSGVEWTERQQDYAAARHDHGIYTPQMVVNGQAEFVGSREREAFQAITAAAAQAHAEVTIISVATNKQSEGQFKVSVGKLTDPNNPGQADVYMAITETGLHSSVKAGENSGVDVHHSAVVRILKKISSADPAKDPTFSGEPSVKLDKNWKRENLRAVVFVQEKRSHHVLGAAEARIQP
jgi:hypothetical protein